MDKDTFYQNLIRAVEFVIPFSQKYLTNQLPNKCLCLVNLNMSYDENPLVHDEETFPDQKVPMGEKYPIPLKASEVIEHLWKNDKVPEWINVTVFTYNTNYTYLSLDCCGRFTATDGLLYHVHEGYPPFHVLGPAMHPEWKENEKFDLFWLNEKPIIN